MLTVTEVARKKVLAILESEGRAGQGLRITVQGGGCSGVQYGLTFVEAETTPGDVIEDFEGLRVHMDPASAKFLDGGKLDYLETLTGAGFKVESPQSAPGASGEPPKPTGPQAEALQELLDTTINPGVASHGGWVSLVDVKDNVVYLKLGGGCQGCGMVNVTLKQGIEVMIKEKLPEILAVYDVTDHAGGNNPYYQPAKS
jgi:Fe/S biogenesis protein NfuA